MNAFFLFEIISRAFKYLLEPQIHIMELNNLFFILIVVGTSGAQQLISPCPTMFTYDITPENDRWSGTISITSDSDYSGLWMRTIFDKPLTEMTVDFGEVVQREPTEFLIKRPNHKISTGETIQIRIFARFSSTQSPPKLLGFRLNGRTICPVNGIIPPITTTQDGLVSPCPELFNYDSDLKESDKWFGTITLSTNRDLNGVWLRIILDRASIQLGVSSENWFGEVTTEDNKEYLIKNRNYKLKAGETTPLRFFVKYNPAEAIPKLVSYRLNAETVCPAGGLADRLQSQGPDPPVFGSDFNPASRPGFLPGRDPLSGVNTRYPCGAVAAQPRPLITHGVATREGQWPWHAALYYPKSAELQYICGASLITMSHVLTAAHCVAKRSSNAPVNNDDIEVYLGKYHLKNFTNQGIQNKKVTQILIHPEYNHRFYANDIAIVKFVNPAVYTDYVRPVCLWAETTDLNEIVEKEGTVVGWGYDHTGKVTEDLTKANMPVVSHPTCIWSYPDFFAKFANEKTFCAGFRNGTSVCNGDSGGGLVFPKQSSNPAQPIWQIRGIVSISVALQSEFVCDTSHYAIFTDSAKYLDWIKQNVIS